MRVGFTPFHENNVTRLVLEVPQFGSVLLIEENDEQNPEVIAPASVTIVTS